MIEKRFYILLNKWRQEKITSEETAEFLAGIQSREFDELIGESWEADWILGTSLGKSESWQREKVLRKLRNKYNPASIVSVHRTHFIRTAWFRVAVAVLIILSGIVVYDQFLRNTKTGGERSSSAEVLAKADILPGSDKAVLTLSDGRKIELNDGASGVINDGDLLIKNNDGQLSYGQAGGATHPAAGAGSDYAQDTRTRQHPSEGGDWRASYNTMATPRGGQYKLVLPDGSKVWLNAESSITFPTIFGGNTREVKISGEAYFEIKADKTKPFIVKTPSDEIQVLGTSFNINAYNDAPVKTSLLEGSIKVKNSILKPGQAFIDGKIISTNIEQDLAWKNGLFNFNELTLEQALRQIARWYDIEVKYMDQIPRVPLWGKMGRQLSLQQLLETLRVIGVKAELENRILKIYS